MEACLTVINFILIKGMRVNGLARAAADGRTADVEEERAGDCFTPSRPRFNFMAGCVTIGRSRKKSNGIQSAGIGSNPRNTWRVCECVRAPRFLFPLPFPAQLAQFQSVL